MNSITGDNLPIDTNNICPNQPVLETPSPVVAPVESPEETPVTEPVEDPEETPVTEPVENPVEAPAQQTPVVQTPVNQPSSPAPAVATLYDPVSFVAQAGIREVQLSWQSNDKNSDDVSYALYRDGTQISTIENVEVSADGFFYVRDGIAPTTNPFIELASVNFFGIDLGFSDRGLNPSTDYRYEIFTVQDSTRSPGIDTTVTTLNEEVSAVRDSNGIVLSAESSTACNTSSLISTTEGDVVASTIDTDAAINHAIELSGASLTPGQRYNYQVIGTCINGDTQTLGTGQFIAGNMLPNTGAGSSILVLSLLAFGVIGGGVLIDAVRKRHDSDGGGGTGVPVPQAVTYPYNGGNPGIRG